MTETDGQTGDKTEAPLSLWQRSSVQLAILLLLYLLLRLAWMITLPVAEAPDEPNHWWVSRFLTTHLRLPTAHEVHATGTAAVYGSLPQLGYLPNVFVGLFACGQRLLPFFRLGSVLAGIPTVLAAFAIGKEIFPGRRLMALALPLLVLVHPQMVFVQSYTNTDAATISLASVSIYLVVCAIKRGLSMKAALLLGFLMGWMALSKYTGLSIAPALGLGIIAATFGRGEKAPSALAKIGAALGVFAATCGWWFVRNYQEFSGDILGSRTMYETWTTILPHKDGAVLHPWPPLNQIGYWRYVFYDFFGLFGYMNRLIYRPVYVAYLIYAIVALVGWTGLLKWAKGAQESSEEFPNKRSEAMIWFFFILCPLLNLAAMATATLLMVTGPHGRYLFPSVIPICALVIAGFFKLGIKFGKWATLSLIVLHLAVTVGSWIFYYSPGCKVTPDGALLSPLSGFRGGAWHEPVKPGESRGDLSP